MSRNSSGTYSQPTGTSAVSGATIDPTAFNTLVSDLGSELTNSLDRGGRGAMTAALNLGGFKAYNAAEPGSSSDLATKNYVDTSVAGVNLTGYMQKANNLSDVANAATAATNLGLGTGSNVTHNTVADAKGDLRRAVQNAQTANYTLSAADAGKSVALNTNTGLTLTVPANVFASGDMVTIINTATGNQTLAQGTSLTLTQAGATNTGNRTLAQNGVATVIFTSATTAFISGAGLS